MSNIEWTDVTWNPVIGCTPVSPGCLNCYAATMANRLRKMPQAKDYHDRNELGTPYDSGTVRIAEVRGTGDNRRAVFTGDVRCLPDRLGEPLAWKKPRRVFVCSMADLFHESVPFEFIDRVFAVMALSPQHTFQVLTKRPERMAEYLIGDRGPFKFESDHTTSKDWIGVARDDECPGGDHPSNKHRMNDLVWPLPNVWLGTSVENQEQADKRIPHLLACPAAVRFLSCEPLLGPVDLTRVNFGVPGVQNVLDCRVSERAKKAGIDKLNGIDWVIVGGESHQRKKEARPLVVRWVRSIVDQCAEAGVPCFVKQLGTRPVLPYLTEVPFGDEKNWPEGTRFGCHPGHFKTEYHGRGVRLRDPKGGDMAEWPEELRVRQFPKAVTA